MRLAASHKSGSTFNINNGKFQRHYYHHAWNYYIGPDHAKYKFPFPIVLVLAGLCISLIPGLPTITLNPEVVFLIFLPALLYGAAWNTNWHEFKSTFRTITMAAVALVLFTVVIIAIVAHAVIPGIDWPLAFLIGAIVSPPDAVAAASITKGLGLHPAFTILEGESCSMMPAD